MNAFLGKRIPREVQGRYCGRDTSARNTNSVVGMEVVEAISLPIGGPGR